MWLKPSFLKRLRYIKFCIWNYRNNDNQLYSNVKCLKNKLHSLMGQQFWLNSVVLVVLLVLAGFTDVSLINCLVSYGLATLRWFQLGCLALLLVVFHHLGCSLRVHPRDVRDPRRLRVSVQMLWHTLSFTIFYWPRQVSESRLDLQWGSRCCLLGGGLITLQRAGMYVDSWGHFCKLL